MLGPCEEVCLLVNVIRPECGPRGNDTAHVPRSVVNRREDASVLWMYELRDQQWRSAVSDGHTKSKKEASCNEHAEVDRDALQNNAENHDQAANDDSPTTAQHISCVGDTWKRH